MKRFILRRLVMVLSTAGALSLSTEVMAGGFQLWEQDIASIGNYHSGYAAELNNASAAWYNPAGITLFKNQELVVGGAEIMSDFKYTGSVAVNTLNAGIPVDVVAQGGASAFVPDLNYVAPLNSWIGFGFSINAPFGSKVDYGRQTFLRYANVRTAASVVDISPSLGFQVTDKFSWGIGFDIQKMRGEFDQEGVLGLDENGDPTDTDSTTNLDDTGYGMHAGALYQFNPCARIGISYHSQVVHHLSGDSKFIGPLADVFNEGPLISNHATLNMTLPAYTALSGYARVHPKFALLGSVIYTQWSSVRDIILNNVAGIQDTMPSTTIQVSVPQHFHNSWNFSVGADYYATDNITLRSGVGYDETPTNNTYRNVQLPDNNRFAVSFGGHYQTTKHVGFDLGWTHLFMRNATIHPPAQVTGDQVVTTVQVGRDGTSIGGADVFGAGMTWDIV